MESKDFAKNPFDMKRRKFPEATEISVLSRSDQKKSTAEVAGMMHLDEVGSTAGLAQRAEPDLGHDGGRGRGHALQPLLFQVGLE